MSLTLLTPPAAEPITLAEAKAFARIETADDDALVAALILAARTQVETATGRALVTQSWRLTLDALPPDGVLRLPRAPLQAVTAVRVRDAAGAVTVLDPAAWQVDAASPQPRLCVLATLPPMRAMAGLEIDLTLGYGEPAAVPEPLRQAVRLLVAAFYDDRSGGGEAVPLSVRALIAPYRVRSL